MVSIRVSIAIGSVASIGVRIGAITIGAIEEGRISLGSGLGLSISRPGRNISFKQSEVRLLP